MISLLFLKNTFLPDFAGLSYVKASGGVSPACGWAARCAGIRSGSARREGGGGLTQSGWGVLGIPAWERGHYPCADLGARGRAGVRLRLRRGAPRRQGALRAAPAVSARGRRGGKRGARRPELASVSSRGAAECRRGGPCVPSPGEVAARSAPGPPGSGYGALGRRGACVSRGRRGGLSQAPATVSVVTWLPNNAERRLKGAARGAGRWERVRSRPACHHAPPFPVPRGDAIGGRGEHGGPARARSRPWRLYHRRSGGSCRGTWSVVVAWSAPGRQRSGLGLRRRCPPWRAGPRRGRGGTRRGSPAAAFPAAFPAGSTASSPGAGTGASSARDGSGAPALFSLARGWVWGCGCIRTAEVAGILVEIAGSIKLGWGDSGPWLHCCFLSPLLRQPKSRKAWLPQAGSRGFPLS